MKKTHDETDSETKNERKLRGNEAKKQPFFQQTDAWRRSRDSYLATGGDPRPQVRLEVGGEDAVARGRHVGLMSPPTEVVSDVT